MLSATGGYTGYSYDPYGAVTSGNTPTADYFGFAGEYTDAETGFEYLQARYYDPNTGEFISVDPLKDLTGQPYAYAGDDPLSATDPTGLCDWWNILCWFSTPAYAPGLPGTPDDITHLVQQAKAEGYGDLLPYLNSFYQLIGGSAIETLCNPQASAADKAFALASLIPIGRVFRVLDVSATTGARILQELRAEEDLAQVGENTANRAPFFPLNTIKRGTAGDLHTFIQGEDKTCWAACSRMVLADKGIEKDEEALIAALGVGSDKTYLQNVPALFEAAGISSVDHYMDLTFDDLRAAVKLGGKAIVKVGKYLISSTGSVPFYHAVIVDSITNKWVYLRDPGVAAADKVVYAVPVEIFRKAWRNGEAVIIH